MLWPIPLVPPTNRAVILGIARRLALDAWTILRETILEAEQEKEKQMNKGFREKIANLSQIVCILVITSVNVLLFHGRGAGRTHLFDPLSVGDPSPMKDHNNPSILHAHDPSFIQHDPSTTVLVQQFLLRLSCLSQRAIFIHCATSVSD